MARHFLAGKYPAGSCAMPIDPGLLCDTELPWLARFDEKWWRLMTPLKPLPWETPDTSTFWPALKISAPIAPRA